MRGGVIVGNTLTVAATEANYGGSSYWVGTTFVATAGTTTCYDFKVEESVKLFAGSFYVENKAVLGDKIEFEIYDVDNVRGADTAGSIRKYINNVYVVPGERRTLSSGQTANLDAGVYLRIKYHSTGQQDVKVILDWLWFRPG